MDGDCDQKYTTDSIALSQHSLHHTSALVSLTSREVMKNICCSNVTEAMTIVQLFCVKCLIVCGRGKGVNIYHYLLSATNTVYSLQTVLLSPVSQVPGSLMTKILLR